MGVLMNVSDWFRAVFGLNEGEPEQESSVRAVGSISAPEKVAPQAGRVTLEDGTLSNSFKSSWVVSPPNDYESYWRFHELDTQTLSLVSPKELLDMLVDLSPDIAAGAWHFLRLCNPGYEYKAYKLGGKAQEDEQAKAHLDNFFARLRDQYGSVDIVLGRFFMGAYLRGAFCGELVLDDQARESLDLVSPDPYSIRFRKRMDSLRGEVWQPGQWQNGNFVPLDIPNFRYLPVDPVPASPYGRALAAPALFAAIFSLSLFHDIKRVIMQQGYKRMDISLDMEKAMDAFSYDPQGYASLGEYMRAAIAAVKLAYAGLKPDDAFIHTDLFKLETPQGTVDSDSIGAIDDIMERLEKLITRALKSNGVVMDTSNNTNETDSNRKWEIHAAGIKSLQHHCENMLESLLTLSCQAVGIQAVVEFRFAELRAAEMFRDEQTRTLRIQNSRAEYEAGFVSQDEASNKAVNHDADVPEPRNTQGAVDLVEDNNAGNEVLNKPDQNNSQGGLQFREDMLDLVENKNGHYN
jgi:hypothetical protein